MRASRYKDANFPLIPAYYPVISYRVSAAELRLLKTVAKDMYGELDLIDARPPTNLSLSLSYDTILDKLLALLLYLVAKRAFERKRGRNCSRPPSGSI
jgi:hypothetical protein